MPTTPALDGDDSRSLINLVLEEEDRARNAGNYGRSDELHNLRCKLLDQHVELVDAELVQDGQYVNPTTRAKIGDARNWNRAVEELKRARAKFGNFNSGHEGWAAIKEELDELWDHIRAWKGDAYGAEARKEAIQVAAMGIRFATDCCPEKIPGLEST